jgi:hypothetical protein
MAKRQLRRTISVSPKAYYALREHVRDLDDWSMSGWVENLILKNVSEHARRYGEVFTIEIKALAGRIDERHIANTTGESKCSDSGNSHNLASAV